MENMGWLAWLWLATIHFQSIFVKTRGSDSQSPEFLTHP